MKVEIHCTAREHEHLTRLARVGLYGNSASDVALRIVQRRLQDMGESGFLSTLEEADVANVLLFVSENPGADGQRVAEHFAIPHTQAHAIVDELLRRGLVDADLLARGETPREETT